MEEEGLICAVQKDYSSAQDAAIKELLVEEEELICAIQKDYFSAQEAVIKELLGRWVSELEPALAFQKLRLVGLTAAGTAIGDKPFILRI